MINYKLGQRQSQTPFSSAPVQTCPDLTCPYLTCSDSTCPDSNWPDSTCPDSTCPDSTCPDLTYPETPSRLITPSRHLPTPSRYPINTLQIPIKYSCNIRHVGPFLLVEVRWGFLLLFLFFLFLWQGENKVNSYSDQLKLGQVCKFGVELDKKDLVQKDLE